jgi:hypothetical protein
MIAHPFRLTAVIAALLLAAAPRSASAVVLAYEEFNYAPVGSDLNGQSGGGSFGFTGPWIGQTSYNVGAGSLASPLAPAPQEGNSVTAVAFGGNRGVDRALATPLGTEGTSAYISFLIQPQGILHQGAFNGWFAVVLRGSTEVVVGMGSNSEQIGMEVGFEEARTNVNAVVGQTFFSVLRIDFTEGVDPVYMYLNPQPGAPEPATPSVSLINLNVDFLSTIGLAGPGASGYDSLRIGTTYADVTPIPEPATWRLAALCVLAIAGSAQKKAAG